MPAFSAATRRAYAAYWAAWTGWCESVAQDERESLDARALLERYLIERWRGGASPPTLRAIHAGLRAGHVASGREWPDPDRTLPARWGLALERHELVRKQTPLLTAQRLAAIEATDGVRQRASVIALIRMLRDGLLDVGDVRRCRWADVAPDNTSIRLHHPEREIWLSPETAQAFVKIRPADPADDDPIYGVRRHGVLKVPSAGTLTARIRRAAEVAGLGDRYAGKSPRYGMLADLPEHVGRDPLPPALEWASRYANAEVVRWYLPAPSPSGDATGSGPPVVHAGNGERDGAAAAAEQLRAWLRGQARSAVWTWRRLGIQPATARAWAAGRAEMPGWMLLVLAADTRASGVAPAADARGLAQLMHDGNWSGYALASGLGVSRQTIQRWLRDAAPDLVLRYAIGELELRVLRAARRGRGAATALRDPSYRALVWPTDGAALDGAADTGARADVAEVRARLEDGAAAAGAAQADAALTRSTAAAGDATEQRAAVLREADDTTQLPAAALYRAALERERSGGSADEVEALLRDAAAAGIAGGTPQSQAIAAAAMVRVGHLLRRSDGSREAIEDAYREAASLGRTAGTPEGLTARATAQCFLGWCYELWQRPSDAIEAVYADAITTGRSAATPFGQQQAAFAALHLGHLQLRLRRPATEIEQTYREAAALGEASATPLGLESAAAALLALGNLLARERPATEIEQTYREAAALGEASATPLGLESAAAALLALGNLLARERPATEIEQTYREAAALGEASATPLGLESAAAALLALGNLLARERPATEIEQTYREAAALGEASATPLGLESAAAALLALGDLLARDRPATEIEQTYREAAALGEASATPLGLESAAAALLALGNLLARDRPAAEIKQTYRAAAAAGRKSGTQEGLLLATQSSEALAINAGDRAMDATGNEAEAAWRDVVRDGRAAGSPQARESAALASQSLVDLLQTRGADPEAIEATLRDAAEDGRAAGTLEGREIAAWAAAGLADQLRARGANIEEIEAAARAAAEDGRAAGTAEGRAEAVRAWLSKAEAYPNKWDGIRSIEDAYREAMDAAHEAGTPDALLAVGRSLYGVGAYREALAIGREAVAPGPERAGQGAALIAGSQPPSETDWSLLVAQAGLALGRELWRQALFEGWSWTEQKDVRIVMLGGEDVDREAIHAQVLQERRAQATALYEECVAVLREAAAAGETAGTREGQKLRSDALIELGYAYGGHWGREAVAPRGRRALLRDKEYRAAEARAETAERAYREAVDAGMAAGSPEGLINVAVARGRLGDAYQTWQHPREEIEAEYRAVEAAGREAGTPEGLGWTAWALARISEAASEWPWPYERIAETCREAAAAGREAGTPQALVIAAGAMRRCGNTLNDRRRLLRPSQAERQEIAAAYREAAKLGEQAGHPRGQIEASRSWLALALASTRWGDDPPEDLEDLYKHAVATGRASGYDRLPHVATALIHLAEARMGWGRPLEEIKATYEEAVGVAKRIHGPARQEALVAAYEGMYQACRRWKRPQEEIADAERRWRAAKAQP